MSKKGQLLTAETYGMIDHEQGVKRVASQSKKLTAMMDGRKVGQTPKNEASSIELMDAWYKGYDQVSRTVGRANKIGNRGLQKLKQINAEAKKVREQAGSKTITVPAQKVKKYNMSQAEAVSIASDRLFGKNRPETVDGFKKTSTRRRRRK